MAARCANAGHAAREQASYLRGCAGEDTDDVVDVLDAVQACAGHVGVQRFTSVVSVEFVCSFCVGGPAVASDCDALFGLFLYDAAFADVVHA